VCHTFHLSAVDVKWELSYTQVRCFAQYALMLQFQIQRYAVPFNLITTRQHKQVRRSTFAITDEGALRVAEHNNPIPVGYDDLFRHCATP
jgi:hypothetical protein